MNLLQSGIAGELANGNTLNLAILAAVAVFGAIMVYTYFRRGGRLKAAALLSNGERETLGKAERLERFKQWKKEQGL
jgi:hypothetical protein